MKIAEKLLAIYLLNSRILLGSFSITMIINGLAIIGKADSHISQSVQGILLLLILLLAILAGKRSWRAKEPEE